MRRFKLGMIWCCTYSGMVLRASQGGKTWSDMALYNGITSTSSYYVHHGEVKLGMLWSWCCVLLPCTLVWCASLSRLDELLDDLQAAKGGKIMRKDLNCLKRTKKLSPAQTRRLHTLAVLI